MLPWTSAGSRSRPDELDAAIKPAGRRPNAVAELVEGAGPQAFLEDIEDADDLRPHFARLHLVGEADDGARAAIV